MKLDEYIKAKKNLGEWIVDSDIELSNSFSKLTLIKTETLDLISGLPKATPKLELLNSNQSNSSQHSAF